MSARDPLPDELEQAVAAALMTEELARDVDAYCDGLIARVQAGELTLDQALEQVVARGADDALAVLRARRSP